MKAYVRLVKSDGLCRAERAFGEDIYTPQPRIVINPTLRDKTRTVLVFLGVCFGALAFVVGMSLPLP